MKNKLTFVALMVFMLCVNTTLTAQRKTKNRVSKAEVKVETHVSIDQLKDGVIEKSAFLKVDSLKCSDSLYIIKSFSITFQTKDDTVDICSPSNFFMPYIKMHISKMEPGGKVWIENIYALSPDSNMVLLPVIALKIK